MDPLKTFEKRLLSGNLIDSTKIKTNRPAWLCTQQVPRLYRELEAMVSVPTSHPSGAAGVPTSPLDTSLVYQLLLASGLPQTVLATLWDQCSRTAPGVLLQHEFYQALALVAVCQKGHPPNPTLLLSLPQAPLPQLAIAGYPLPLTTPIVSPEASVESASHPPIGGAAAMPSLYQPISNATDVMSNASLKHTNTATQDDPSRLHNSALTSSPVSAVLLNGEKSSNMMSVTGVDWASKMQPSLMDNNGTNSSMSNSLSTTNEMFQGPSVASAASQQPTKDALEGIVTGDNTDDDDFGDFADFQSAPVGKSQSLQAPAPKTVETLESSFAASLLVERHQTKDVITSSVATLGSNGGQLPIITPDLFSFDIILNGKKKELRSHEAVTSQRNTSLKKNEEVIEPKASRDVIPLPKAKTDGSTKATAAMPKPTPFSTFPSVLPSLFNSITVQMTETVQPPTEPNPWLHYPLLDQETSSSAGSKDRKTTTIKKPRDVESPLKPTTSQTCTAKTIASFPTGILYKCASADDDEFDEFADFQSAPSEKVTQSALLGSPEKQSKTEQYSETNPADKYSVFRMLETDQPESKTHEQEDMLQNKIFLKNGTLDAFDNENELSAQNDTSSKVDILALMKLPTVPTISLGDELSILDSLTISSKDANAKSSAIDELQDLDLGYSIIDGQVAAQAVNSTPASPAKSIVSIGSIGESRGNRRLSLFNKANYSECASLSSFELGPNTESNGSSPTKGSILSLELNSPRRTLPEEGIDENDTLEWNIDGTTVEPRGNASTCSNLGMTVQAENTKATDEFCWAQPPIFPPPDPTTDFSKPSSALQDLTGLYLLHYPNTQVQEGKRNVTKEQVAESWARVLGKVAAVLETATHILGNDRGVLTEVLATTKGQRYASSLLEVYNVSQQIKKAAVLFNVDGIEGPLEQVENAWRRQLEDLTVRLGLSVICLDHLLTPLQSSADTCAVCLLPLALRPRLLFGDHAYHATCANFWANVLAEGLPCLKLY
ncbi:synergin gamma-like [Varroa destructor]|uniref:EH domain-containing protein n=1 Tax=Varroa destructor TaxID=109461 RepID=A0A7M7JFE1_VARDE|nr:synergin gamma-like [Varroa destructor]XP_022651253.1 synergin gamma-like [Varroa destructor]XP_022651254.1 synergin gamma-like [Varroa destructor]